MSGVRSLTIAVAGALLSGCAGVQSRQALTRLQAQVGLLDERVTQLERSTGGVTSSLPDAGTDYGVTVTQPAQPANKPSASQKASAGVSSLRPAAREIQQALKNAGFYQGAVDGRMGPQTKDAVKEFQRVHGLTDDGVVGRQTWSKLQAYADLSSGSGEANAAEVLK